MNRIKILYPRIEDDLKQHYPGYNDLRKILAKSTIKKKNYYGREDEIRLLISGSQEPFKGLSLANNTASFDLGVSAAKNFLRADPVHLRADKNRVYLFDSSSFEIKENEAIEVISELNKFFKSDLIRFHVGTNPYRWYVEGIESFPTDLPSPSMLNGLPLETSINNMLGYRKLKTFISEIQMLLFDLPLNKSRVKDGNLPINSLWLWGGGDLVLKVDKKSLVVTDCDIVKACCCTLSVDLVDFDSTDFSERSLGESVTNLYVGFSSFGDETQVVRRIKFLDFLIEKYSSDRSTLIEIISNRQIFTITFFTKFKFWKSEKVFKNSGIDNN